MKTALPNKNGTFTSANPCFEWIFPLLPVFSTWFLLKLELRPVDEASVSEQLCENCIHSPTTSLQINFFFRPEHSHFYKYPSDYKNTFSLSDCGRRIFKLLKCVNNTKILILSKPETEPWQRSYFRSNVYFTFKFFLLNKLLLHSNMLAGLSKRLFRTN